MTAPDYRTDVASGLAGSVTARPSPIDILEYQKSQQGGLSRLSEALRIAVGFEGNVDIGGIFRNSAPPIPGIPFDFDSERGGLERLPSFRDWINRVAPPIPGIPFHDPEPRFSRPPGLSDAVDVLRRRAPSRPAKRAARDLEKRQRLEVGGDLIRGSYERYRSLIEDQLNQDIASLTQNYQDSLDAFEKEIKGYQTGLGGVNVAYAKYQEDADRILGEAAQVEAEPLPDTEVVETVEQSYDRFEGELFDTLKQIGSDNPEIAAEMSQQLRFMEDVIEDGIRSETISQAEMHELASLNARALANLAWKDDLFKSERSRFEIELQIQKAISDKQEQVADTRKQMERAIQKLRDEGRDEFDISPDELWGRAMQDFLVFNGLDAQEAQDITRLWDFIREENPQAMVDFSQFKSMVHKSVNRNNLARLGILDQIDAFQDSLQNVPTEEEEETYQRMWDGIEAAFGARNTKTALRMLGTIFEGVGVDILRNLDIDAIDWNEMEDVQSSKFQNVLDLWSHHRDFRDNFSDYVQPIQSKSQQGSLAPNNYANRNHPEYRYRRQVVAPFFADMLRERFPGIDVGALGYIRKPEDVGEGRVSNSDHQSGGAIDVYYKKGSAAESDAQLKRIAAWARGTPGISMVVYEGNKYHQKLGTTSGHVHISFQIRWRIPGSDD